MGSEFARLPMSFGAKI
ncbi:small protein YadW [Citrobacter sp. RHB21-C01]